MKLHWIVLLLAIAGGAVYGIDRGIYIGSTTTIKNSSYPVGQGVNAETRTYSVIFKNCRYLFISGIIEMPALGGHSTNMPGQRFDEDPDTLHCRIFAE